MPSPEIDHSQAKLKPPASGEASCKPTFGTCVLNHASDETSFQLVWDMSDSNEIIRKQVFGLLRAGHTIDIYGLS